MFSRNRNDVRETCAVLVAMRSTSPQRQRAPRVSINLVNCKYELCELSILPGRLTLLFCRFSPSTVYCFCTDRTSSSSISHGNLSSIFASHITTLYFLCLKSLCTVMQYGRCERGLGGRRPERQMNGISSGPTSPSVWLELLQCSQCRLARQPHHQLHLQSTQPAATLCRLQHLLNTIPSTCFELPC